MTTPLDLSLAASLGASASSLDRESRGPLLSQTESADRDQLRAAYAEIATLAGGLAHEIRNPLSTVRVNIDLLLEDVDSADDPHLRRMRQRLETIQGECGRLDCLLTAFLNFARVGELHLVPRDLSTAVAEFATVYQPEAFAHGIEIRQHLASGLPNVLIDEMLFRQALFNLARNAQQAMPRGGVLELQTVSRAGHVVLEVIDTGAGILAAIQPRLFDLFFSTKHAGTGLGLPTVRKIIEAHGGNVTCDSEPGSGTRFTVWLPVTHSAAAVR